jgi:hypothetical protein
MHRWSCLLVLLLVMPGSIHAATLHVPSEYPTIQEAIDAAVYGDTVEVACGYYCESHINIQSGVCLRSETGDPECVTIDGIGVPILRCIDVDEQTLVEGIALTAGYPAVTCENASPPSGGATSSRITPYIVRRRFSAKTQHPG